MIRTSVNFRALALFGIMGLAARGGAAQRGLNWKLPPGTAIPVEFSHAVNADKAKRGDLIEARTMQVIHLGQGHDLPKGTLVLGRIIMSRPVRRDVSASVLSFRFDQIVARSGVIGVRLYVRALANFRDSYEAGFPTPPPDMNLSDTRTLIGGDQVTPSEHKVYTSAGDEDGDVVGEYRKGGVFERLRAARASNGASALVCDGTSTEQSVAIFSGSACGLYGFDAVNLVHTGKQSKGVIELDSRHYTVKLYSMSTALLQVAPEQDGPDPQS